MKIKNDPLFNEFIITFGQTLEELADDQRDIARSSEAVPGDREMVSVIEALPELIRHDEQMLTTLFNIYKRQRR
ncbi:hypothetical protein [Lacticaseibacillus saniviri]